MSSPLSTSKSSAAFQCDFLCGFAGSFEMVSAHETNCALNPALSSDVSTNMHVDSSTHSPDSPDTPMHTLEIINLRDNLRTSDFEQFKKAGTQTPAKQVVAHHLPTPTKFRSVQTPKFRHAKPPKFWSTRIGNAWHDNMSARWDREKTGDASLWIM